MIEHVDAVVDTGFTGWLTLPADLAWRLSLFSLEFDSARVADGRTVRVPLVTATVLWENFILAVPAMVTGEVPLIGMQLLRDCRLTIEAAPDGAVRIERMG